MTPEEPERLQLEEHVNKSFKNGAPQEIRVLITPQETGPPRPAKAASHLCRHRPSCSLQRLAIMSIICGISCLGIKALLLALRAEQEGDQKKAAILSRRSRRWSVLSIVLFVGGLICLPFLVILVSYIMTLIE